MGPRSYERGIVIIEHTTPNVVAVLQWGRVLTNAESAVGGYALAGAAWLQWGRVLTNAESRNAALGGYAVDIASMGPRSYERGILRLKVSDIPRGRCFNGAAFLRTRNPRDSTRIRQLAQSFNGAAFLRTRNVIDPRKLRQRTDLLQWGRVLTNAESRYVIVPRVKVVQLQWGRVLTNAESFLV